LAAAAELTPEEMARGEQLARTLDELDRLQAEAAVAAQTNADAAQAALAAQRNASQLDTLAQAARAQQAAQAAARLRNQQETLMALGLGGTQSSDSSSTEPRVADFEVTPVNRNDGKNWGKLRSQSAEDLTKGKSEVVSEEYRKSVETYFRVLAERAKKK
jgi:multidrug efflux pump subunit AcrA (membrane-fusion protein)